MKQEHSKKVKLARKMMTQDEIVQKVPIFLSAAWLKRRKLNKKKVLKKLATAKKLKALKEEKKNQDIS